MGIISEQYEDIIDSTGRVVGRRLVVVRDAEPALTSTPLMTHLAFLERMTAEEYGRFENFLASSVDARFAKAKFDIARDVNVQRPDVQGFAYTLRAVGVLLADERVAALLALKPLNETGAINPVTFEVTP
jgi:hypothetical protein